MTRTRTKIVEPVYTSLDESDVKEAVWDELFRLRQYLWHCSFPVLEPVWHAVWTDGWQCPPPKQRPAEELPLERALDELHAIRSHFAGYGDYQGKIFEKFAIDELQPVWAAIDDVLKSAGSYDAQRRALHALEFKLCWVAGYVGAENLLGIEPDETPNEPFVSLMSSPWKAQNWARYVLVGELKDGDDRFKSFADVHALEQFLLKQQHKQKAWDRMSRAKRTKHPRKGVMRADEALLEVFEEAGEEGLTMSDAIERLERR